MGEEYQGPNDYFGVFHEEKSVFIGDPYSRDAYQLSRHKGKGFGVPFQPKGSGPDAMIDKTTKLRVPGDTYVEPMAVYKEPKRTSIHNKAFVPVGGPKKPSGAGSLYGLIGPGVDLLDTDASVAAAGTRKKSDVEKKRAIYVTPAKKGSFGFPWQERSIGATRFEFIPDEYCRGRILEKEMKAQARAKISKAFISTGRTGQGIKPMPYSAPSGQDLKPSSAPSSDTARKPWKGCSPSPKGRGYGCLSPLKYVPCPQVTEKKEAKEGTKAFKPTVGGGHNRLSMWAPSPYAYAARPPPDNDFTLTG